VLAGGDDHVPYDPRSVRHVAAFVRGGGGLVLMANAAGRTTPHVLDPLAGQFGAAFSFTPASGKAKAVGSIKDKAVTFTGGGALKLTGNNWQVLVQDEAGAPLMARRHYSQGNVLVASRGLFGSHPDASDRINSEWIPGLLQELVAGKPVDAARPPRGQFAELTKQVGPLTLEFHEGTRKFADATSAEYAIVRKHLVEITTVEPSPGMITKMLMLPTGGGGFSSGERIAIGAWWGDYPKNRYPMIELIAHEAGHSWVLPYGEPVWNEPIATYLGILVGKRMGMDEAQQTLERAIAGARRDDPDMTKVDITKPGAPNSVIWGKSFWIFEQLEKEHGPGAIGKYFKTKRTVLSPGRRGYSVDDCVAVWSKAVGKDLFPWFKSIGMDVDKSRTDVR
jgi:hypothetical protein